MGEIINEGNEVLKPSIQCDREWAAHISVHVAKYIFSMH